MSASIGVKTSKIGPEFFQKTAQYLRGAAGDYIQELMPKTTSIASSARSELSILKRELNDSVMPIRNVISGMKSQSGSTLNKIHAWYMSESDALDGVDVDSQLSFDGIESSDTATVAEAEITEFQKGSNTVAKSVISSSAKLMEAQIETTANILASLDKQTAVISAGFKSVEEKLDQLIEVTTKNTSTLIEATVASAQGNSKEDIFNGKFSFKNYKDIVKGNIQNSQLGPALGLASTMLGLGKAAGPDAIISMLFSMGMDKAAPNLKKNMNALDDAINSVLVDSLIRLGERKDQNGFMGIMGKIFGIQATDKKAADTSRKQLELKSVPFDSVTKEAIVNVIPGYLKDILHAITGKNQVYNYQNRKFVGANQIQNDFTRAIQESITTSLSSATKSIQKSLPPDTISNMLYDLIIDDIGKTTSSGEARKNIASFRNRDSAAAYINRLTGGVQFSEKELQQLNRFIDNMKNLTSGTNAQDLIIQAQRTNMGRNQSASAFVDNARRYNEYGLESIKDDPNGDRNRILQSYGKGSNIQSRASGGTKFGVVYTNSVLYEIYRRLNRGINVFQVGSADIRTKQFKKMGNLGAPVDYRESPDSDSDSGAAFNANIGTDDDGWKALQESAEYKSGSKSQKFGQWAKMRGGNFARAMFSGNPDDVKAAFMDIAHDVQSVGFKWVQDQAKTINDSYGNLWGHVKHKMFGTGYSYADVDQNGNKIIKKVADNDKGGLFGFVKDSIQDVFGNASSRTMNWFKSVAGFFTMKSDADDDQSVEEKRSKLLTTSVGAMAGLGILGGPLGLLAGSLAGVGLYSAGIGKKLKRFLFGEKDQDGETITKGIFGKAMDSVINPVRYAVGKVFDRFTTQLRKNILGPIADLGFAIKSRIVDSVKSAADSTFGKLFRWLGGKLMGSFTSLLSVPGNLVKGLANVAGLGITGSGEVSGGILRTAANLIATKDMAAKLRERQADRKNITNDSKYDSYSAFQASLTSGKKRNVQSYMEEQVTIEEQQRDLMQEQIKLLEGIKDNTSGRSRQSEAMMGAAIQTISANDEITDTEINEINNVTTGESGPGFFSKMKSSLSKILRWNKDKKSDKGGKNILEKMLDFFTNGGIISKILGGGAVIAGIKAILDNVLDAETKQKIKNTVVEVAGSIWNFMKDTAFKFFKDLLGIDGSGSGNHPDRVSSPFSLTHTNRDAEGNRIMDSGTMRGLGGLVQENARLPIMGKASEFFAKNSRYANALSNVNRGVLKFGTGFAIGASAGNAVGDTVANMTGSDMLGNGAAAATQVGAMWSMRGAVKVGGVEVVQQGGLNKLVDGMLKAFGELVEKLKSSEQLKELMGSSKTKLDSVLESLAGTLKRITPAKLAKLAANAGSRASKIISRCLTIAGLNTAGGTATAGLANIAMGTVGGIAGAMDTANLFRVRSEDTNVVMNAIASILGAIFNGIPMLPLVELADIFIDPGVRETIAITIYDAIAEAGGMESSGEKRERLATDLRKYNDENGTNLSLDEYNNLVNPTLLAKVGKVAYGIKDTAVVFGSAVVDTAKEDFTSTISTVKNFIDDPSMKHAGEVVTKILSLPLYPLRVLGKFMMPTMENIAKNIQEFLGPASEKAPDEFDLDIYDKVMNGDSELGTIALGPVIRASMHNISAVVHKIGGGIQELFDHWMSGDTGEQISGKLDSYDEFVSDDFIGSIINIRPWEVPALGIRVVTHDTIASIYRIGKKIGEWVDTIKEFKLSDYTPWGKENKTFLQYVGGGLGNLFDKVGTMFKDLKELSITDVAKLAFNSFGDWAKDKYASVTGSFSSGGGLDEVNGPLSSAGVITSNYGPRIHPIHGMRTVHRGVDIIPANGATTAEAVATSSGTVVDSGYEHGGGGNYVTYQGDDGYTYKYMHLASQGVSPGARVNKGNIVGRMGNTGGSTGPHLHYQVEKNGHPVNPFTRRRAGGPLSEVKDDTNAELASSGGGASGNVEEGLRQGVQAWLGKRMDNGTVGCAEAVGKIGSYYSPFLKQMKDSGVVSVVGILQNAAKANIPILPYDRSNLSPGDAVTWDQASTPIGPTDDDEDHNNHIGIYTGMKNGAPWGVDNSSSELKVVERATERDWQNAAHIIKTGDPNAKGFANGVGGSSGGGSSGATSIVGQIMQAGQKMLYGLTGGLVGSLGNAGGKAGASVAAGAAAEITGENEKDIWTYLTTKAGYSKEDAAAIMGNFAVESGYSPTNLQNDYERSLGMDDNTYTQKVDSGAYGNFDGDSAGYGLAQWTYGTRKKNLLDYVKSKGSSIGDLGAQLEFFDQEAKSSYGGAISMMKNAAGVDAKTKAWMDNYEGPDEDPNVNHIATRISTAQSVLQKYGSGGGIDEIQASIAHVPVEQIPEYNRIDYANDSEDVMRAKANAIINMFGRNSKSTFTPNASPIKDVKVEHKITETPSLPEKVEGPMSDGAVVDLLNQMLSELRTISGNTGESTKMLSDASSTNSNSMKLRSTNNTKYSKSTNGANMTHINQLIRGIL
jgi:N-acetylmuramoyl-L-alanine amidase